MAANNRRRFTTGRNVAVVPEDDDPPIIFSFEDSDEDDAEAVPGQQQDRPAAGGRPGQPNHQQPQTDPANALQLRVQQMQAMVRLMEARNAAAVKKAAAPNTATTGAVRRVKQPKVKTAASSGASLAGHAGNACAAGTAAAVEAAGEAEDAAAEAGTAAPEVSPELLLEDMQFILGDGRGAEDEQLAQILQAQVQSAAPSPAPGSPAKHDEGPPAGAACGGGPHW
ncbi:hypothetical protein COO60DRAFT_501347 [Scenedesmus sp. NREL 46B-D3]|nr:hypothetical protein COO60DRAFT_501347 [Scenedesmus sp. NREL 46B-D3]